MVKCGNTTALRTDRFSQWPRGNGADFFGSGSQFVPRIAARIDNGIIIFEDAVGEVAIVMFCPWPNEAPDQTSSSRSKSHSSQLGRPDGRVIPMRVEFDSRQCRMGEPLRLGKNSVHPRKRCFHELSTDAKTKRLSADDAD
jgi:hypothetical protein